MKIFAVILFAVHIGFISSLPCPDGTWTRYLHATDSSPINPNGYSYVCVKMFNVSLTWLQASEDCRGKGGRLIDFQDDYYFNLFESLYATFDLKEFWTGMYVSMDRFAVPLLDGVPTKAVNATKYDRKVKSWSWAPGQPNFGGRCQLVKWDAFLDRHNSSMMPCDTKLPYYCQMEELKAQRSSFCPPDYVMLPGVQVCYKLVDGVELTGDEAAKHCSAAGARMAEYNGGNEDILAEVANYYFRIFGQESQYFYVNASYAAFPKEESGLQNGTGQSNCFALSIMEGAYIRPMVCSSTAGVICQTSVKVALQEDTVPILDILDGGSFNRMINSDAFKPQVLQCSLSRNLTDMEKLVFFHNSVPLEDTRYVLNPGREGMKASFSIPFSAHGTHYRDQGDYRCEIQRQFQGRKLVSRVLRYTHLYSSLLTYRGSVNLSNPVSTPGSTLHNLKFSSGIFTVLNVLRNYLSTSMDAASQRQDSPISLKNPFGTSDIGKMSENGESLLFSIYFEFSSTSSETSWFTPEIDQKVLSLLRDSLENSIKFGSQPQKRKRRKKRLVGSSLFTAGFITSTASCPASTVYNADLDKTLTFGVALAGTTIRSVETCITDKRPLANVTCMSSFYNGAYYTDVIINRKCLFTDISGSNSTSSLRQLAETNITDIDITELLKEVDNLAIADNLASVDVIYIAEILSNIAKAPGGLKQTDVEYASNIVNTIIGTPEDVLTQSQDTGSATSRLVEALETIANKIILDQRKSARIVDPFVAMEIREFAGNSGLVVGLELRDSPEVTITNTSLNLLEDEINLDILDVDAAIVLPKSLLAGGSTTRLLMQVYASTKLFSAISSNRRYMSNGKIVAATLTQDQHPIVSLGDDRVKTIFKPFKQAEGLVCGFWDYNKNDNSGGWSTDGCVLQGTEKDRAICVCDHLTNFAILIDFEAQGHYVQAHQLALTIITIVGLALSIIGLSFTVLCFVIFRALRKTRGQKVLFQLAVAMLCSWVVFLAGVEQTSDYNGCIVVAVLLHYLILVTFMWLLVEGLLQYLRFVKVLGTYIPRFMLKASMFAWGVPLIPVIVVCAIDYRLYDGGIHYCWMSLQPFYYAFALPVGVVIFINIIIFALVVKNIVSRPEGLRSNQTEAKRAWMNFWAALSIFVLLGVTWIFGYLAIEDARIPFQYMFTICNAFQGFLIFVLFITRDPQVRNEWMNVCCRKKQKTAFSSHDSASGSKSKESTAFSDLSSKQPTSVVQ